MARPQKTGLDYFPFDVGFFGDEKIAYVAGEFGIKAEIVAVKLLCAIYRNGYFIVWNDEQRAKLLCSLPGVSSELLDQILNRLLRWGFLHAGLFESDKILTSAGIQRRYFEATKFRKLNPELPYLLLDSVKNYAPKSASQTLTPISQTLTPISQHESTQNKIKDKINLSNPPLPPKGETRGYEKNFIQLFFEPSRTDALRTFCSILGFSDDGDFTQLRALVNDANNYLELSGKYSSDFSSWACSIQNIIRSTINRKRSQSPKPHDNDIPLYNQRRRPPGRNASDKLPTQPACKVKRRPN
ncbi:MAG: DUF4373 domain-containing protein [Muribaculaceae bacterium]|nr:DUF4373 domain-containing protein [Muribaculaceae bacterium]